MLRLQATVFEGKAAAKAALQAAAGLPVNPDVPVFGYIGRLEEQKGARRQQILNVLLLPRSTCFAA